MSTHVLVALGIWGAAILFIVRFFWACSPRRDQRGDDLADASHPDTSHEATP